MPEAKHMPWSIGLERLDVPDLHAIKAIARGDASEDQQRRAMKVIIEQIASTYDMSFHPDNARATDFAEGKRHVGRVLVGIINFDIKKLNEAETRKDNGGRTERGRKRTGHTEQP
jgi:hypothetical protein